MTPLTTMTATSDRKFSTISHTSFFKLPASIRERIYIFAGLVRVCPIEVALECTRWARRERRLKEIFRVRPRWSLQDPQLRYCPYQRKRIDRQQYGYLEGDRGAECICASLPVQLLRISRLIGLEARNLLYSRNMFKLDSAALHSLPPDAYSRLLCLQVRLTDCSCITGHRCQNLTSFIEANECSLCHTGCKRGPGAPLESVVDATLLNLWQTFVQVLKETCTSKLSLTLICDSKNFQTALDFMRPLENFPKITSCSIRLGQSPNDQLKELAESTARGLIKIESGPFQLEGLPLELQELIFSQTDLITASEIAWNYCSPEDRQKHEREQRGRPLKFLRRSREDDECCMQCNEVGEICTCPIRHAAYPARNCKCWRFPMAIFLVNKRVNQLAMRIFFSENRFSIWDTTCKPITDGRTPEQQARYLQDPLYLLRSLPTAALAHIRCITLQFCSFDGSDALPGTTGHAAWVELTSTLKTTIPDLSRLTITLDFMNNICSDVWINGDSGDPDQIWTSYQNIAELFRISHNADRYRDFDMFIDSPGYCSPENQILQWRRRCVLKARVMGESWSATRKRYEESVPAFYEFSDFCTEEGMQKLDALFQEPWDGNVDGQGRRLVP